VCCLPEPVSEENAMAPECVVDVNETLLDLAARTATGLLA
jgi:hypothetical protein